MKHLILQSKVTHTDDTGIKLLEGAGKAISAKFWPYLGDSEHPHVVFDLLARVVATGRLIFFRDTVALGLFAIA